MAVVLEETDRGSKKRLWNALERMFKDRTEWNIAWDEFWTKVEEDAKVLCPVDTGALRESIRVINIEEAESVNIGAPEYAVIQTTDIQSDGRIIVAGDETMMNPKTFRPVDYAQAVHDGHVSKSGKWVEGTRFLETAIDLNMPHLLARIESYIDKEKNKFSGD